VYKQIELGLPNNAHLQSLIKGKNISLEEEKPAIYFSLVTEMKNHIIPHMPVFSFLKLLMNQK